MEERIFKFGVGDKVVALLDGFQCPRYNTFFKENGKPELEEKFVKEADIPLNTIGTVVLTGISTGTNDNTYAIEINNHIYIMGEDGVFGALEEVDPEELKRIEADGVEKEKQRFLDKMDGDPLLMLLALLALGSDME